MTPLASHPLIHYSSAPVVIDHRKYDQRRGTHNPLKPAGLWLSQGDAWQKWCEAEDFMPERLTVATSYRFADTAKILELRSVDIPDFTRTNLERGSLTQINWQRLASRFDGIYFLDYHPDGLPFVPWFLGLDVPSACVWNPARALIPTDTHLPPATP